MELEGVLRRRARDALARPPQTMNACHCPPKEILIPRDIIQLAPL